MRTGLLQMLVALSSSSGASSNGGLALPDLVVINWQRLPDLNIYGSGFQNSDGGWVSRDSVVAAFGHGYGKPSHSFLNTAHILNVTAAAASSCRGAGPGCAATPGAAWQRLPDAPVTPRQDVASAAINGAVYILGGFSYSAPYSYADFLKLAPGPDGAWKWTTLPPFPYPLSMHATAAIGSRLYVQGGACYNRKAFFNWADCNGTTTGLGKRLYVFDTADPHVSWERLPDCPGPPKANAALSSVGSTLYLIGGMSFVPIAGRSSPEVRTLTDNWKYDPASKKWWRLADLPVASGNFQTNGPMTAFEDRYIILIGGYQYGETYLMDNSTEPSFGLTQRMCPPGTAPASGVGCLQQCHVDMPNKTYMGATWSHEYNNDVFVYDTQKDLFGRARGTSEHDPGLMPPGCGAFPIDNNLPQVNVLNDTIFAVGGECNDRVINGQAYGHYPPLALVGKIVALEP